MKTTMLVFALAATLCSALVTSYKAEPTSAAFSGWTRTIVGYDTVGQTICCNFDSLRYVELFAGDSGASAEYQASVLEDGIPVMTSAGGYWGHNT